MPCKAVRATKRRVRSVPRIMTALCTVFTRLCSAKAAELDTVRISALNPGSEAIRSAT